tara:strand:- start:458 stop:814 length:357 start_codon:yes stop_codon:yes gene_type:complete
MPGTHNKKPQLKAKKDNSVYGNKPKFILGAIGNALSQGSSSFGRTAGNLLAGKLFGVDPNEAIKASNPNQINMSMMNMLRPMMQTKQMKKIAKELKGASKKHGRQAAKIESMIKNKNK